MNMAEKYLDSPVTVPTQALPPAWHDYFTHYRSDLACDVLMQHVAALDQAITSTEPFKLVKVDPERAKSLLTDYVCQLATVAQMLVPVMPDTSAAILDLIAQNKKPEQPLFPRLDPLVLV